ncbi:MAG: hypothetical protein PHW13_13595 [Methylococcales bacterium]|nr:hypothetical protein [Methylococcales bacterium]
MNSEHAQKTSTGVDELIARLKEQGIAVGQEKAESIVLDAEKRAEWIISEATREAQELIDKAKAEAEAIRIAGEDGLKLAGRDAFLKLRDMLSGSFKREVMRLVGNKMAEKDFLESLILALAGEVRHETGLDQAGQLVIQLPEHVLDAHELRKDTEELQAGELSHFVIELATGMLRSGVELEISADLKGGVLLRLEDDDIIIDFTDQSVATLLLDYLQPRFHALLEGISK